MYTLYGFLYLEISLDIFFICVFQTSIDDRCALCGQLMGMVTFFVNLVGAAPSTYRLRTMKVVVRHSGQYTLALGGDHLLPDRVLLAQLDFVHRLFRFYHRDFEDVAKVKLHHISIFTLTVR